MLAGSMMNGNKGDIFVLKASKSTWPSISPGVIESMEYAFEDCAGEDCVGVYCAPIALVGCSDAANSATIRSNLASRVETSLKKM